MLKISDFKIAFILSLIVLLQACIEPTEYTEPNNTTIVTELPGSEEAHKWGIMTLQIMYKLAGNTPVYASRAMGYMGLTMYETVVNGSPRHKSLAGQLKDLPILPKPTNPSEISWPIALNAGQAFMLKNLYSYVDLEKQARIDSLENAINNSYSSKISKSVLDQSVAYGQSVANVIWEWSKTDGGFLAYYRNFDANYIFPTSVGHWIPPVRGQMVSPYPMQPTWGSNRTFAPINATLPVPNFMVYSAVRDSPCYKQFDAVYQKNKILTQEEREIAAFWADDPSETFSPPGHSYSIANIVVKQSKPDIFKAAETYARVGMAVADAFINCWKTKYTYHSERPFSYIQRVIDPQYIQFWPEPPFPAFYSGHSTQAAACSAVLTFLYGPSYPYIDNSHQGRAMDTERNIEYKNRSYESFEHAALEAGYSRILGGIHTPMDNEVAFAEGTKCGNNVNALAWRK